MPPQQADGLLDFFNVAFDVGAHGNSLPGGVDIVATG
jgi:hypothetical protein